MIERRKQISSRCVMDITFDDTIRFNEKGCCNYREDVMDRKDSEFFPNKEGKEKSEEIFKKIKRIIS